MPTCSSVSSSAQSSTTMATLLILSLNRRGSVRRARSTSVSNSGRVMRERPRGGGLEAADSFHVHDVLHFADALHDALQLLPWREEMAAVISARIPGRSCPM